MILPTLAFGEPPDYLHVVLHGPQVPFTGTQTTRVTVGGTEVRTTVRVSCDGKGAVRHEYLGGPASGVVLLQKGGRAWERSAEGVWELLSGPLVSDDQETLALIARNYALSRGPSRSMLERSATEVRIRAKRPYQPSRTIWVEEATGIVLKDRLEGPDGRLRSETEMTHLTVRPQSGVKLPAPTNAPESAAYGPASFRPSTKRQAEAQSGQSVPLPRYLPSGFVVANYGLMRAGSGRTMPAVRYLDGLASFTIFRRGRMAGMRRGVHPGLHSDEQKSVVAIQRNGQNYLLVGDIAESELRKVAESL